MDSSPIWTVYQTRHLESGKVYIGVHKTSKPEDRYLGSGNLIKAAIKRHGAGAFRKEVLFVFDSAELAYAKEEELVNAAFVQRTDTYNLMKGGVYARSRHARSGEDNSQYGSCWVHDGAQERKIKRSLLESFLREGWAPGRGCKPSAPSGKGSIHVFHPERKRRRRVLPEQVPALLKQGWALGSGRTEKPAHSPEGLERIREAAKRNAPSDFGTPKKGSFWIHQGSTACQIFPEDLPSYPGWERGMPKRTWVTDGQVERSVLLEEAPALIQSGWVKGRLRSSMR